MSKQPDSRTLHEITDALRALKDRADAAGSTKARAILTMTAEAMREIAEEAEREMRTPARRPGQAVRRFGEG